MKTPKAMKEDTTPVEHLDFLGCPVSEGDRVITHQAGKYHGLVWGTVDKLNPKMLRIKRSSGAIDRRYAHDVIVLSEDQEQALAFKRLREAK